MSIKSDKEFHDWFRYRVEQCDFEPRDEKAAMWAWQRRGEFEEPERQLQYRAGFRAAQLVYESRESEGGTED
jgi:hypothetical protein